MTRSEFDIACKLSIGFVLEDACIYSMDKRVFVNILVIHGFTETGINFNIEKETFMEYDEFMDIVPHINHIMGFNNVFSPMDIINSYNQSGIIPFISSNFHHKIVP